LFHRAEIVKRITIIGGGLAGLTLGIALRRNDVPVALIEAGKYPRHRVCGEFISGSGLQLLERLGLGEPLCALESRAAQHTAFFSTRHHVGSHRLPEPALAVSRFVLDAALARTFQGLGGDLRQGERWQEKRFGEAVVCAAGRRPCATENGWRWFGLKAHARNVALEADLEMHLSENAYVGLCQLVNGEVNVCGLFRRRVNETAHGESMDWLRGEIGSRLFARLEHAEFTQESFCAVAGLSLRSQPIHESECRLGDALTMIPPITGNGMSMAFESAHLAVGPLTAYSRGDCSWQRTTAEIARSLRRIFTRRLQWAGFLHRLIFSPVGAVMLPLLFRCGPAWRASFALTR
jgi:2-polyprenyl-6-methoxyphenol hydroxylase-like FAD-dependent oxidoreductase